MVEHQARDLEVRVQIPVQVHIFLLIFNLDIHLSISEGRRKQEGLQGKIENIKLFIYLV